MYGLRKYFSNHASQASWDNVVVVTLSGQSTGFTGFCAWLYLAARILYVPAYALGLVPWRSVIWAVGFLATVAMIVASLV